jgi:glycosyltransferase involved in cell wall biosynthesis
VPAILHIITGLDRGGAELQLRRTVDAFRRDGRQVVLSLRPSGALAPSIEELGCQVVCANIGSRLLTTAQGVQSALKAVSQQNFDVIVGWLYHGMTAAYAIRSWRFRRKPLIWMVRSSLAAYRGMSLSSRANVRLARSLSKAPEAIVYNSARSAEEHAAFGFAKERSEVIHNGIDSGSFNFTEDARAKARRELDVRPQEVLVGLVARYHPVKDHHSFIASARIVAEQNRDVRFALFGKGADTENAELIGKLRQAQLVDRFILGGERVDMACLLPGLDIAVNSSLSEGFSNTLAEAMMSQVPCVATDVGDSAVIVGTTGRVVRPSAPAEMASALTELILLSSEERRRLGVRAREHALRNFSTSAADSKFRAVLARIAS